MEVCTKNHASHNAVYDQDPLRAKEGNPQCRVAVGPCRKSKAASKRKKSKENCLRDPPISTIPRS
eukprot:2322724-Amphidinium_carterae.1